MQNVRLPYIDNAKAVIITLAINLGVVFYFNYPLGITFSGILWDTFFCVIITTIINICIVYFYLKKMRTQGAMPANVPESRLMQLLPKNPFLLGIVYIIVFSAITICTNALITTFFALQNMSFLPWLFYKLIYATLVSIKIIEYSIFRYVQPDWAKIDQKEYIAVINKPIKNPLPKISVYKEMYAAVMGNIALNIVLGSFLGGIKVENDGSVVIYPSTVEAIPITGLILGLIVAVLVVNGVINSINKNILNAPPETLNGAERNRWLTWLPKRKATLMSLVSFCLMLFSAVSLWGIMMIFGIQIMNFFQFIIYITIYASIICKIITYIMIKRCTQRDYIEFVLIKKEYK